MKNFSNYTTFREENSAFKKIALHSQTITAVFSIKKISNFICFHIESAERHLKTGDIWHFLDQNGQILSFFWWVYQRDKSVLYNWLFMSVECLRNDLLQSSLFQLRVKITRRKDNCFFRNPVREAQAFKMSLIVSEIQYWTMVSDYQITLNSNNRIWPFNSLSFKYQ